MNSFSVRESGPGDSPALDEKIHDGLGRQLPQLEPERLQGNDVERLTNDQLTYFGVFKHVGEQVADVEDFAEALEHLDKSPMLALGEIGIHDVVVKESARVLGVTASSSLPGLCTRTVRKARFRR